MLPQETAIGGYLVAAAGILQGMSATTGTEDVAHVVKGVFEGLKTRHGDAAEIVSIERLAPCRSERRGTSRRSADARHHRACASDVTPRPSPYGLSVVRRNPPDDCAVSIFGSCVESRRPDADLVSDESRHRANTLPKER